MCMSPAGPLASHLTAGVHTPCFVSLERLDDFISSSAEDNSGLAGVNYMFVDRISTCQRLSRHRRTSNRVRARRKRYRRTDGRTGASVDLTAWPGIDGHCAFTQALRPRMGSLQGWDKFDSTQLWDICQPQPQLRFITWFQVSVEVRV